MDETWSPDNHRPFLGIILGVLVKETDLPQFERLFYGARKKYYGDDKAKNKGFELKGKKIFSNFVLNLWDKYGAYPNNICFFKEITSFLRLNPEVYFKSFTSIVFCHTQKPNLVSPNPKLLSTPFRSLISNVSTAGLEDNPDSNIKLVFDQRVGCQTELAISMYNFISGIGLKNIHPYPYFAVSNVCPLVQIADIFAHLVSKRAQKIGKLYRLYRELAESQWVSKNKKHFGFNIYEAIPAGKESKFRYCKGWPSIKQKS